MAINSTSDSFHKYLRDKFKGRLIRIEKLNDPHLGVWKLGLVIRIPEHEVADELEIYSRINKVIQVIAEGE